MVNWPGSALEKVIRYVDRVLVYDEKVDVLIKGGVKVEVED